MINKISEEIKKLCYTGMALVDVQRLHPRQIFLGADLNGFQFHFLFWPIKSSLSLKSMISKV